MEIFDKPAPVSEKTSIEHELENYLISTSLVQDKEEENILLYRKEHEKLFPLIASIARKVLTIPACNTSIEVFSRHVKTSLPTKEQDLMLKT
jgi:hypothetical protein